MAYSDREVIVAIAELEASSEGLAPSEYVQRIFARFPGIKSEQFIRCVDIVYADPAGRC